MQHLILPIDSCKFNAAYKIAAYQKEWGFPHYGVDLGAADGKMGVRSPGTGKVIAAGLDGANTSQRMGYAVVIVYPDVAIRKGFITTNGQKVAEGAVVSLACRMFHFSKLYVKAGVSVTPETVIGEYGATGKYVSGPHLHLEFDIDASAPQHAYGIASSGNVIKKGSIDSTVDPSILWYKGNGQTIQAGNSTWMAQGWLAQKDLNIPMLPKEAAEAVPKAEYDALANRYEDLWKKYDKLTAGVKELAALL